MDDLLLRKLVDLDRAEPPSNLSALVGAFATFLQTTKIALFIQHELKGSQNGEVGFPQIVILGTEIITKSEKMKDILGKTRKISGECHQSQLTLPLIYRGKHYGVMKLERTLPFVDQDLGRCCSVLARVISSRESGDCVADFHLLRNEYDRLVRFDNLFLNLRWKYKDGVGVVYASPPILQFHGCTFEEFHELWSERVHPDDVEEMVATLAKAVATKTVFICEARARRHDGVYIPFLLRAEYDEPSDQFIGSSIDCSDRNLAMIEVSRRESELKFLLKSIRGYVYKGRRNQTMDIKGDYFSELTGIDISHSLPHSAESSFLYPSDMERLKHLHIAAEIANREVETEFRVRTKVGSYRWFSLKSVPVTTNGKFDYWMGICIDVDELKKATEDAMAAAQIKSNFLSTMSHELRTPTAGLIGNLELLGDTVLTADQQELLCTATRSTEKLLSVINDILDFNKLESGKYSLHVGTFSVEDIFEEILGLMAPLVRDKNLEFYALVHPDVPPQLLGDALRIRQILVNLVSNSIKFTEEGYINLVCRRKPELELPEQPGDCVIEFAIEDTGIGIADEDVCSLFKPFTQLKNETRRSLTGTGLGLSICRELTILMGGDIDCESVKGVGSTFRFWVYVGVSRDLPDEPKLQLPTDSKFVVLVPSGLEHDLIQAMLCGYSIFFTTDVRVALSKMPEHQYLIVSNTNESSAFELLKLISDLPKDRGPLKIIVCGIDLKDLSRTLSNKLNLIPVSKPLWRSKLIQAISETKPETGLRKIEGSGLEFPNVRALIAEDNTISQTLVVKQLRKLKVHSDVADNGLEAVNLFSQNGPNFYDIVFMDNHMPVMDGSSATARIRELEKKSGTHVCIVGLTADIQQETHDRFMKAGCDCVVTKPCKWSMLGDIIDRYVSEFK